MYILYIPVCNYLVVYLNFRDNCYPSCCFLSCGGVVYKNAFYSFTFCTSHLTGVFSLYRVVYFQVGGTIR